MRPTLASRPGITLVGLDDLRQRVELIGPHRLEHRPQRAQRGLVRPVVAVVAVTADVDEAGLPEDAEVLRDGTERDGNAIGDGAGSELVIPDERQDLPATRLGDDIEGIAGWWSDKVEGAAGAVGDHFGVSFPSTPVVFGLDVTALSDDTVSWHIPEDPAWWAGSTVGFHLTAAENGGTSLLFTHGGFEAGAEIIEIVTPAWVRYLDNLVAVAESGTPNPAVTN